MSEEQLRFVLEQMAFFVQWVIAPGVATIIALVGLLYRRTMKTLDGKASTESVADVRGDLNDLCERITVLEEARHRHGTELVALREQLQDLKERLELS